MVNLRFYSAILLFCLLAAAAAPYLNAQRQDDSYKVFDDTQVARVDITVRPADLAWLYANTHSDSEFVARVRFRNALIDEQYDSVGFRLRGNTSRDAKKKSFKVSFNTFRQGLDLHGVEKLNLNGEHNDPSIIRSKLCFDLMGRAGITASRAAHAEVYINGAYYGLYISVEHIDEEFVARQFLDRSGNLWKCLYGADLTYLGENQNTYKQLNNNGVPAYELTTNESAGDFSKLVRLIRVLNNTPAAALPDSIEKLLDVAGVMKYFAWNVLLGSWDSYWPLMNNYYLYHDPSRDMFFILPYDYDNTFGVDWSGNNWTQVNPYSVPKVVGGSRPLMEKLLAVPQYKNLYTRFIAHYKDKVFSLPLWEQHIDSLRARITAPALADSFRRLDYGFDSARFVNSYTAGTFSYQHVKQGLKQFVNLRNNSLPGQLSSVSAAPLAYRLQHTPQIPPPTDSVRVECSAVSNTPIVEMKILFLRAGASTPDVYPMAWTGDPNSGRAEVADRYTGYLPPLGRNGTGQYTVQIRDAAGLTATYPRGRSIAIRAGEQGSSLVINEFMADNTSTLPDPSGEYDDWIELYNPTSTTVQLTGKYLTDNPTQLTKWRVTQANAAVPAGGYQIIWCDEQGSQPGLHANFKLSKSGEYIVLTDTNGTTILDSITFGPQQTNISFGRYPNGGSTWAFMPATPGSANTASAVETARATLADISAYPNPATNYIVLSVGSQLAAGSVITIYNSNGQEVLTQAIPPGSGGRFTMNIGHLAAGVYFARLLQGATPVTVAFIKVQ